MAKKPRFDRFVGNLPATNMVDVLPLTHGTTSHRLRDIISDKQIKPKLCETIKKNVIFTFYGKPAYRPKTSGDNLYQHVGAPAFLILDSSLITKENIAHPFDTGAVDLGIYEAFLGKSPALSDFSFKPDSINLSALVHHFYGDNESYLQNKADTNARFDGDEFEAQAYHATLLDTRRLASGDERSTTVEIALKKPVSIRRKNIRFAIIPDVIADGGFILDGIVAAGIEVETYAFRPGLSWESYVGLIYNIVENRYRNEGLL